MTTFLKEVKRELRSAQMEREKQFGITNVSEKVQLYNIVSDNGEIFSAIQGWQSLEKKGDVMAHSFEYYEILAIRPILEKFGYTEYEVKKDRLATNLLKIMSSPFGNPQKMMQLLLFTALAFVALTIALKYNGVILDFFNFN